MAAAASTIGTIRGLARERARREALSRRTAPTQDRDDSPFLHPHVGEALLLAASPLHEGPEPVAVVLADGTVRALHEEAASATGHTVGRVRGRDWTLWWERRRWTEA